jgi:AcrR family transcriptional regulator
MPRRRRSDATRSDEPRPARGRPARLSRDEIARTALALLERAPGEPLTVARIAREVGAAPAALYRHFTSLDELRDAVLGEVLGAADLDVRRRSAWPEQVRGWMSSLRAHLLRYPSVLPLIGRRGRTSPAWLEAIAQLVVLLERGGLAGPTLARAALWIAEVTVGIAMQEASLPLPDQIAGARASLSEMSPHDRARLARLVPDLVRLDGEAFFSFVVDRTVDAVMLLAGGSQRVARSGRRGAVPSRPRPRVTKGRTRSTRGR